MGSPTGDPVTAVVAEDAPEETESTTDLNIVTANAIDALAWAMALKAGHEEPDIEVARRAAEIVNATLDASGPTARRFVVLLDGSQLDAERLAQAVLSAAGVHTGATTAQLLQAGEAITLLANEPRMPATP